MSGSLYDLMAAGNAICDGPSHQRLATVFEVVRGHGTVLAELSAQPGRWLLFLELDPSVCVECGTADGRYLQFAVLEDGASVIGECSSNAFLEEPWRLTDAQELDLLAMGWQPPDDRVPNWYVEARTPEEVARLAAMSGEVLTDVFGLDPRQRVTVRFCEQVLEPRNGL